MRMKNSNPICPCFLGQPASTLADVAKNSKIRQASGSVCLDAFRAVRSPPRVVARPKQTSKPDGARYNLRERKNANVRYAEEFARTVECFKFT